jgi:AcrR family transcriptional regulator
VVQGKLSMSGAHSAQSSTRSDQRIPKLRTRGRANRQKLLAEVQQLIEAHGGRAIRFSEVFKAAGVSRGSAYRIYNGIEDLMQDLASTWINNFVDYIKVSKPAVQPESWMELSEFLYSRAAEYWVETADTLRVLPRVRTNVPESYKSAVKDLTKMLADKYDEYFVIPVVPEWRAVLAMYISLGDMIFADAVRREGRISEQRLLEAQKISNTYMSFYLPSCLQARSNHS